MAGRSWTSCCVWVLHAAAFAGKALLKNPQPGGSAEPAAPLPSFLHRAADVLEGEGARPFLATQAPHVNSLNKCSHFSQLIHCHVCMLKLCQTVNAANSPTVHHSWRWNCSSPLSAFPPSFPPPAPNCLPEFPGPPSSQELCSAQVKMQPRQSLERPWRVKGRYK